MSDNKQRVMVVLASIFVALISVGMLAFALTRSFLSWRVFWHAVMMSCLFEWLYLRTIPVKDRSGQRAMPESGKLRTSMLSLAIAGTAVDLVLIYVNSPYVPIGLSLFFGAYALLYLRLAYSKCSGRSEFTLYLAKLVPLAVLISVVVIALFPMRSFYFEQVSQSDIVIPRPDIDVILGGDAVEVRVISSHTSGHLGKACFYTGNGAMVAFAHSAKDVTYTREILINDESVGKGNAITNRDVGVVFQGIPVPADRLAMPLGGLADVNVGGLATVHVGGRDPIKVTVTSVGTFGGPIHIALIPVDRARSCGIGDSGAPVVQDGVIIGFVTRVQVLSSSFHAILAAEVWNGLEPYLVAQEERVFCCDK